MNAALAPNGKGYLKFQVAFWLVMSSSGRQFALRKGWIGKPASWLAVRIRVSGKIFDISILFELWLPLRMLDFRIWHPGFR